MFMEGNKSGICFGDFFLRQDRRLLGVNIVVLNF